MEHILLIRILTRRLHTVPMFESQHYNRAFVPEFQKKYISNVIFDYFFPIFPKSTEKTSRPVKLSVKILNHTTRKQLFS